MKCKQNKILKIRANNTSPGAGVPIFRSGITTVGLVMPSDQHLRGIHFFRHINHCSDLSSPNTRIYINKKPRQFHRKTSGNSKNLENYALTHIIGQKIWMSWVEISGDFLGGNFFSSMLCKYRKYILKYGELKGMGSIVS